MSRCERCIHQDCGGVCIGWDERERGEPVPCDVYINKHPYYCACVLNKFDENEDCTHYEPLPREV